MNTKELKNIVIEKIYDIDDEEFLLAIKTILDMKTASSEIYHLTDTQRERIKQSKQQIAQGLYTSGEQVFKEIDEWLK